MKPSKIGGQAVMEGIMMRRRGIYSVTVRKPNQDIVVDIQEYKGIAPWEGIYNIPFIRGIFAFVDSLILSIKTLTFSASFFEEEEDKPRTKAQERKDEIITTIVMLFGVILALSVFMILPFVLSSFLRGQIDSRMALVSVEGLIRLSILVGYVLLVSQMKEIKRTFMYHGAEHKCINCIEQGLILNLENARESSKEHKRCGTSFLFFVIVVSIIFSFFITVDSQVLRALIRIAILPLIAGVSYEIIMLAGKSDNWFVNALSFPGRLLQKLTTKEPDDGMLEVAIVGIEAIFDWREFQDREEGSKFEPEGVNVILTSHLELDDEKAEIDGEKAEIDGEKAEIDGE